MENSDKRVLLIYKLRKPYGCNDDSILFSYGLSNSARFVSEAINDCYYSNVDAAAVGVIDNNDIDRVVSQVKPTHVIIEAIWVIPDKFKILMKLHPNVKWVVRIHSKTPFLAYEGIAFDWINKYLDIDGLLLAGNNIDFVRNIRKVYGIDENKFLYLPNIYYNERNRFDSIEKEENEIHVGCFGCIRPLKNTLQQALASIMLANRIGKKLFFHINSRTEQGGEQVLKNLRALFSSQRHVLVEHEWMQHTEFMRLVSQMDIGLQVSMSESFNIVVADFVCQNIPVVVSDEISWVNCLYKADANCAEDIAQKMERALLLDNFNFQFINRLKLVWFNEVALDHWLYWVEE